MIDRHPALSQTSGNQKRPASVSSTCVNQVLSKRFCQPCLAGGQVNRIFPPSVPILCLQNAAEINKYTEQQLKSNVRELVVCVKISWQFNIAVVDIFVGNLKIGNLICWLEFANCKNVPHFLNEDDDVE
ncbi:hypothetical protein T08_164 [Trichinella sp. T8]|nr:hypothetical protein T08_164 [Trichinella sp. T8]